MFPKTAEELTGFVDHVIDNNRSVLELKDQVHELGLFMENMQKEMRAGFDAILH